MYYLCSENKGADQLRGYREADLRLCFRICKNLVFSRRGSYDIVQLPHRNGAFGIVWALCFILGAMKVFNHPILMFFLQEFPILCQTCLGDNPYLRMVRSFYIELTNSISAP